MRDDQSDKAHFFSPDKLFFGKARLRWCLWPFDVDARYLWQ